MERASVVDGARVVSRSVSCVVSHVIVDDDDASNC